MKFTFSNPFTDNNEAEIVQLRPYIIVKLDDRRDDHNKLLTIDVRSFEEAKQKSWYYFTYLDALEQAVKKALLKEKLIVEE